MRRIDPLPPALRARSRTGTFTVLGLLAWSLPRPVPVQNALLPPLSPLSYALTDLETLKVSDSSSAIALNESGQVVGSSGHAFLWERGRMKDLVGVPDSTNSLDRSYAHDINERGQVVGSSGSFGPIFMSGLQLAASFLYSHGQLRRLDDPHGDDTEAFGINDKGQVVGLMAYRAFLWEKGRFTDLKTLSTRPSGNGSRATRINNKGQVVGATTVNCSGARDLPVHGFLWQRGKMTDLGTLPRYENSIATDLNGRGQVVGYTSRTSS